MLYNDFEMEKKLKAAIQFKCEESFESIVADLAKRERRPPSQVARAIFERGLASFSRDGLIFEPQEPDTVEILNKIKASQSEGSKLVNEKVPTYSTLKKRA